LNCLIGLSKESRGIDVVGMVIDSLRDLFNLATSVETRVELVEKYYMAFRKSPKSLAKILSELGIADVQTLT
jgi:hypothetical protein